MNMNPSPMLKAADFDFGKEAEKAGATQAASTWTPSDNAMASSQLSKLLASDSKLMTQARSKAAAASSRRGLLNSSIGVEAGESAAIQSMVPIAQQDASTWGASEQFNAGAANDFARDSNAFGRNSALTKYQGILAQEAQSRDHAWRSGEATIDRDFQSNQSALDRNFRGAESALDRGFQERSQMSDQAFRAAQAGLDRTQQATLQQSQLEWQAAQQRLANQFQMDFEKFRLPMNMMSGFTERMQSFVTQIMSDPNMDAAAKDQAIKNYYAYSQQTMGWMSNFFGQSMPNMATGGVFNPVGTPGASAQQPGGVQQGGVGVGPGADIGVPRPTPAPSGGPGVTSPVVRFPELDGLTARDIYTSGNEEMIRRYRESLA